MSLSRVVWFVAMHSIANSVLHSVLGPASYETRPNTRKPANNELTSLAQEMLSEILGLADISFM